MRRTGIIVDSHSGITPQMAKELGIQVLPMPFYINEECCYEDRCAGMMYYVSLS